MVTNSSSDTELRYLGRNVNELSKLVGEKGEGPPNDRTWKGKLAGRFIIELRLSSASGLSVFCEGRYWTSLSAARGALTDSSNTYDEITTLDGRTSLRGLLEQLTK